MGLLYVFISLNSVEIIENCFRETQKRTDENTSYSNGSMPRKKTLASELFISEPQNCQTGECGILSKFFKNTG